MNASKRKARLSGERSRLALEVIEVACDMQRHGINQGTSGNVSARFEEGFLITPSGMPYEALVPDDIVFVHGDATHDSANGRSPSSEWQLHADVYRARFEVGGVVHCHPIAASALSCLRRPIPAFHYMVAVAGGDNVRCADYATFGTAALSRNAIRALRDRHACLLANHGLVSCGGLLSRALAIAIEVEALSKMYLECLKIGEPAILTASQMRQVSRRFAQGYGAGPAFTTESPD